MRGVVSFEPNSFKHSLGCFPDFNALRVIFQIHAIYKHRNMIS